MDKWRPEGWNNSSNVIICGPLVVKYIAFEAGADAMLEALRKQGVISFGRAITPTPSQIDGARLGITTSDINAVKGVLVFIPDDDEVM